MSEEELTEKVKELSQRIEELESTLAQVMEPLRAVQKTTSGYFRLAELAMRQGGLTVDSVLPNVKDAISKDIVRVLVDARDQNITQITNSVRAIRGSASRRIIRERLKELEEKELVERTGGGKIPTYSLSSHVLRKWSELLGIPI